MRKTRQTAKKKDSKPERGITMVLGHWDQTGVERWRVEGPKTPEKERKLMF